MGFFSKAFSAIVGGKKGSKGLKDAQSMIENVELPAFQDLLIDLGRLVEDGQLTAQQADVILQESTGFDDIQTDRGLRNQQLLSLDRFAEVADADGLDARAQARLGTIRRDEDSRLAGDIGAIEQAAARRGQMTSGMDHVNQLIATQASADRMGQRGLDEAALAEERAMEAALQRAQLAGNIEERDYGQQADRARAQDIINQFNVQQRTSTQDANIGRRMETDRFNLQRDRDRDMFNIGQGDAEELARAGTHSDQFDRKMNQTELAAGIRGDRGIQQEAEAKKRRKGVGGIVKSIGKMFSDEDTKENVEPMDTDKFLNELTGYEYNYRHEPTDERRFGVMSDDLKKSEFGEQLVDDTGVFDTVDYEKAIPGMLGALAQMNKRLKDIEGNK